MRLLPSGAGNFLRRQCWDWGSQFLQIPPPTLAMGEFSPIERIVGILEIAYVLAVCSFEYHTCCFEIQRSMSIAWVIGAIHVYLLGRDRVVGGPLSFEITLMDWAQASSMQGSLDPVWIGWGTMLTNIYFKFGGHLPQLALEICYPVQIPNGKDASSFCPTHRKFFNPGKCVIAQIGQSRKSKEKIPNDSIW